MNKIKTFLLGIAAAMLCVCVAAHGQTKINPGTQINWASATGCSNVGYVYNPATNTCTINSPVVYPESYGAKGDGNRVFDAYTAMPGTSALGNGVFGPPITTQAANATVLNIFITYPTTWTTKPTGGTARIDENTTTYAVLLLEQATTTPTTLAPLTGTLTAGIGWQALRVSLAPGGSFLAADTPANNSGTSLTLNVPAGTADADWMMACMAATNGTGVTPPGGWTSVGYEIAPTTTQSVNNETTQCFQRVASSEPASYTFTLSTGIYSSTGFIVTYRGTPGIEGYLANGLQSATANWTANDVNKPICVQRAGTHSNGTFMRLTPQQCGTIAAYRGTVNGVSQIRLSFTPSSKAVSGQEAVWGDDDSGAFNTMVNSAPCSTVGCVINLGSKIYPFAATGWAIPQGLYGRAIVIAGSGMGFPWSPEAIITAGPPIPQAPISGTQLVALSTSMATPLMSISGVKDIIPAAAAVYVTKLSLIGGAGWGFDGGGQDALDTLNIQNLFLEQVGMFNFKTSKGGWYIDGITPDSGDYSYTTLTQCVRCRMSFMGGPVVYTGTPPNVENVAIRDSEVEANWGPAVDINGSVQAFSYINNTSQWNNIGAAAPDIKLEAGGVISGGCLIQGTYFEIDNVFNGKSNAVMTNAGGAIGCDWSKNFIAPASTPRHLTFSAAGTPIPACSTASFQYNQASACVSDSTLCTNGTTYVSGGSTKCQVQCTTGNVWVETGASTGCN